MAPGEEAPAFVGIWRDETEVGCPVFTDGPLAIYEPEKVSLVEGEPVMYLTSLLVPEIEVSLVLFLCLFPASRQVLYHLLNPEKPKVLPKCHFCGKNILPDEGKYCSDSECLEWNICTV